MSLGRLVQRGMSALKPIVVFVLGGPGAGKGTQCERIVEHFGFKHLSAGDLLRAERQSGSDTATLIDNYIKEGKIVPVKITAMITSGASKFLVDGFPRNKDNFDGWTEVMGEKADVRFVLFLECPKEKCVDRCLERGKTSGRTDDNRESLEKRFQTYEDETRPIIDMFEGLGLLRAVDSTRDVDAVFADVSALFESI